MAIPKVIRWALIFIIRICFSAQQISSYQISMEQRIFSFVKDLVGWLCSDQLQYTRTIMNSENYNMPYEYLTISRQVGTYFSFTY